MKRTMTFVVGDENGLHLRPITELVRIIGEFQADIMFFAQGVSANSKNPLSLLLLDAGEGTELTVTADGDDAVSALSAIGQMSFLS